MQLLLEPWPMPWLSWTALALLAWPLLAFLAARLDEWRRWQQLRALPSPPVPSLLLGHAPIFLTTNSPMQLAEWTRRYGSVYRIRFVLKPAVIVTDPALVRAVLQSSKTYIPKNRMLYHSLEQASKPALQNIVTASDGEYWAALRGAWMKCFTSPRLKQVLPHVVTLCERVAGQQAAAAAAADDGWARAELTSLTDAITLDVIGRVSYGRDFGAVENQRSRYLQLVAAMLRMMHSEMGPPLTRLITRITRGRQDRALRAEWDAANTAEVVRALADPPGEHTIIGQLMQVTDPATGKPLTLDQLRAEMVIAAMAGFETTSNALTWTLGSLACHPEVLSRLEQELDAAGLLASPQVPQPKSFGWEHLGRLPYLNAVIREGLRLFSPAGNGSFRYTDDKQVELPNGLVIPKHTAVGIPLLAFGHNPATYGPDTEAFRPERWLTGSSSSGGGGVGSNGSSNGSGAPAPAGAQAAAGGAAAAGDDSSGGGTATTAGKPRQLQDPMTFSIGPRDCAGQALARMELQAVVATLLGRLQLQLDPSVGGWEGLLRRRMFHTTLQVAGGLPVLLRPRA